jgi:hypothetical protein
LVFAYYIPIACTYILSQIELEAKRYGLKHSIANVMNQLSCTLDATNVLEYVYGVQTKLEALLLTHLTHYDLLKTD